MMGGNIALGSEGYENNPKLSPVKDVIIDDSGVFKYILIKVYEKDEEEAFKYIVRGTVTGEYHADIYDKFAPLIEESGDLDCECVGGGRINHDPSNKRVTIYGYSVGYGRAEHSITQAIIQKQFGSAYDIKWSNDGY